MSTSNINPLISYVDAKEFQIPVIEGSCEKYCITEDGRKQYCKYSKLDEVFAEVFTSYVLGQIGFPSVPYSFVIENNNGSTRVGTKSSDFAGSSLSRVSLDTMAQKTGKIDSHNEIDHIYINLNKAMAVIDKFCKKLKIDFNESEKEQMKMLLECQIVIDYAFCNSDHHLRNTEFLVNFDRNKRKIFLVPMFDFGQCLRGKNVQMAFTFSDLANDLSRSSVRGVDVAQVYAEHILKYFKEKYSSQEELSKDPAFRLLCFLQHINIDKEIFKFLCNCTDYKYYNNNHLDQIQSEDYGEIISYLVEILKQSLNTKEKLSWYNMRDAFEERKKLISDGLSSDKFLKEAYEHIKPSVFNSQSSNSDIGSEKTYC